MFPGQGFRCLRLVTGHAPEPDSSSTGGVYCVSGRIPALSISDIPHHTCRIGVFACVPVITDSGRPGFGRYPSRPAPGPVRPGCLTALYTGMRKLLDQKRIYCPYPSVTSSSGPPCPLSRYRTELQIYSAIEKIRPVDGQRLPSAHPAALTAFLKKDWLPPPLTDLPALKVSYLAVREAALAGRWFSIPLPGSVIRLIHPFRGFTGNRLVQSSRKGRSLR